MVLLLAALSIPAVAQTNQAEHPLLSEFFNGDVVQEIRLYVNPSDWQALQRNFEDNTYYPADIVWRDQVVEGIGIRSRGLGSRNATKPGLHVNVDYFEPDLTFLGTKSFELKNMVQDASMMKERVSMLFFRQLGFPAPREAYVRLYINDRYSGVFLLVESIKKPYLRRVLNDDEGYLYEFKYNGKYGFEFLGPEPAKYTPLPFKPETHEKKPVPEPLIEMIRLLNEVPTGDLENGLKDHFDLRGAIAHIATEVFLAEFDGLLGEFGSANFYIYRFDQTTRHRLLVWDKDNTFSDFRRSIFKNTTENVIMRRSLESPELRYHYFQSLADAVNRAGGPGGMLEQLILQQYALIRDSVYEDPLKHCNDAPFQPIAPCTNEQFETAVQNMLTFARERSSWVRSELELNGFFFPPPVEVEPVTVVHGASFRPGAVAPGQIVSMFGRGFGPTEGFGGRLASNGFLQTTVEGTEVHFDGAPAALFYVQDGQINAQVPYSVAGKRQALLEVRYRGVLRARATVDVAGAAPGIFTTGGGAGPAVVVNEDGSLNSPANAAPPGSAIVLYATGEGQTDPGGVDGRVATLPLPRPRLPVELRIGDRPAEVLYAGAAPGFVGLMQLNARVPGPGEASGLLPLELRIGSASSQAGVTIAVR